MRKTTIQLEKIIRLVISVQVKNEKYFNGIGKLFIEYPNVKLEKPQDNPVGIC